MLPYHQILRRPQLGVTPKQFPPIGPAYLNNFDNGQPAILIMAVPEQWDGVEPVPPDAIPNELEGRVLPGPGVAVGIMKITYGQHSRMGMSYRFVLE